MPANQYSEELSFSIQLLVTRYPSTTTIKKTSLVPSLAMLHASHGNNSHAAPIITARTHELKRLGIFYPYGRTLPRMITDNKSTSW